MTRNELAWSSGDTIVLQEVWRDRVWAAKPMTVVRDEDDLLMLWFPRGTIYKGPTTPATRAEEVDRGVRLAKCAARGDWIFRDQMWDVDTLSITQSGNWHSIWISWPSDGSVWGWYVNLQSPLRRTPVGVETMDLMLDVLIDPDRTWRWKDEDELAMFVAYGAFDAELAARARDEGLRVIERAERNEPPFCEPWREEWRPNPSWKVPELADGWDRICR